MRAESIQSIFTTRSPIIKWAWMLVCTTAQAASSKMGKCGARFLCASGQGGARPEPQPAMTVQLYIRYLDWRLYRKHEHLTAISSLPLSLPLPLRCPCCCCYLRRCAADATAVSCANDAIIEGDNDDEGSAYNHRRRCSFKMSAKAASHLQIHLNSNFSRILSAPTPPRCCCTSK